MPDLAREMLRHTVAALAYRTAKTVRGAPDEFARFFAVLSTFDGCLASGAVLQAPVERLFQGPIADALTHAGQIALMRRMAGSPVKAENYFTAEIEAGRIGLAQSDPKCEF